MSATANTNPNYQYLFIFFFSAENDVLSSSFIYNNRKNVSKCGNHCMLNTTQKYLFSNNMMRVVQPHSGPLCIMYAHIQTIQMTITTCPRRSQLNKGKKRTKIHTHTHGQRKTCTFPWIMVCVYFNVINNEKFNIYRI